MQKIVVKFGGSNLKCKEDVAKLIMAVRFYNQPIVIVLSALYAVTDTLVEYLERTRTDDGAIAELSRRLLTAHDAILSYYIDDPIAKADALDRIKVRIAQLDKNLRGIYYLGEIPDFAYDNILSYGERLSSLTLCLVLNYLNIPCTECLPEDLGLITDGEYRNATVDFSVSEANVRKNLPPDRICIVPGFYGLSPQAKVTLLGRGGTDYTAAAIARCINAQSVDIWKDVEGYMSADPKIVDNPVRIHNLSYDEAAELSYFGAHILHPRTFEPVVDHKIPIRLFNINNFTQSLQPLTQIENNGHTTPDVIKSVTYGDDFGILKLKGPGVGIKPGIMARVTTALNDNGINIKSIITAQTCINILLAGDVLAKSLQTVKALKLSAVDEIDCLDSISLIALVGRGMLETPGIAARVFSAVSAEGINVLIISTGASSVATYFIIEKDQRTKAIRSIHDAFFKNAKQSSV